MNLTTTTTPTMTSREIAELTGKEHFHVKRDIQKTLDLAGIDASRFGCTYLDAQNREQTEYRLPRRECDLVISGYSVPYRLAIIDRWHELEKQSAQPAIPSTPSIQVASEWLGMAQLLGVPTHLAQAEAVKQVELKTGIDFRPLLASSPAQDAIEDDQMMLEPADIAKKAGFTRARSSTNCWRTTVSRPRSIALGSRPRQARSIPKGTIGCVAASLATTTSGSTILCWLL